MEEHREMRGHHEHVYHTYNSKHLKLSDLKKVAKAKDLENQYLFKKKIPDYPRPEFHVTHLIHDTNKAGLSGIRDDKGFRLLETAESPRLLWWSLKVTPEDMQSAERRLLEQIYPDRTEEQVQNQQSFLEKFATSPSFLDSSKLGSYRFTFPLEEVLKAYSQQLCSDKEPVMRVFKTFLYKQKVMYAVLVHSPDNDELFSAYPPLTGGRNAICSYRDGHFIWRSQAMCKTHRYEWFESPDENKIEVEELFGKSIKYYVWDNVAVALHLEKEQVLKFDPDTLRKNLTYCEDGYSTIKFQFDDYDSAQELVEKLWPGTGVLVKEAEKSGATST